MTSCTRRDGFRLGRARDGKEKREIPSISLRLPSSSKHTAVQRKKKKGKVKETQHSEGMAPAGLEDKFGLLHHHTLLGSPTPQVCSHLHAICSASTLGRFVHLGLSMSVPPAHRKNPVGVGRKVWNTGLCKARLPPREITEAGPGRVWL